MTKGTATTAREAGARVADLAFLPNLPETQDVRPRRIAEAAWLALTDSTMGKAAWKAVRADDEAGGDASDAVDGDPATFWATRSWRGAGRHPHELIVDLGEPRRFGSVVLLPAKTAAPPDASASSSSSPEPTAPRPSRIEPPPRLRGLLSSMTQPH